MKQHVVIGRTVYKGKELEFKEALPYYVESQAESLIESAKRKIRIRYHSMYPYSKSRLSYSFVKSDGTVKPEKTEKKSIFGVVKAVGLKVTNMTNKKIKIIGTYYVWDADLMEGWTNETLADAIREPLSKIGLDVEIYQAMDNFSFNIPAGEYVDTDLIREQARAIVEKISTD